MRVWLRALSVYVRMMVGRRDAKKKRSSLVITKRQKFLLAVVVLSTAFFVSEYLFSGYGILLSFIIAALANIFLLIAVYDHGKENFSVQMFILPFLYTLAFGLFYQLAPARLLTRVTLTSLYAVGLYSLFLSENIFIVASIRTIALLNGARIVTFILTLISFFFLSNIIFTLRANIMVTLLLLFGISFVLILHAIWTYTLEKSLKREVEWVFFISLCLFQFAFVLWFWPTNPTVIALFLTGVFYIFVGLAHVWLEKRLFKGVLWEYAWVGLAAVMILLGFTQWQGF